MNDDDNNMNIVSAFAPVRVCPVRPWRMNQLHVYIIQQIWFLFEA